MAPSVPDLLPPPFLEVRPLRRGPLNQWNAVLGLALGAGALLLDGMPGWWRSGRRTPLLTPWRPSGGAAEGDVLAGGGRCA